VAAAASGGRRKSMKMAWQSAAKKRNKALKTSVKAWRHRISYASM
jgi:hypothetical protein